MSVEQDRKLIIAEKTISNQNVITIVMIIRLIITVLVLYFVNKYYLSPSIADITNEVQYLPTADITNEVRSKSSGLIIIAFIFTIFILDSLDCQIALVITGYGLCDSEFYERLDKIIDMIALGIFVFVIVPKIDPEHAELAENLWYFRVIGVIGFLLTSNRSFLFIFGNYVEIAVLLSVFGWYNHPMLVGTLFIAKFVQEVILHSGFVNKTDIMKQIGFKNFKTL